MKDLAKLHDDALEYENNIEIDIEMLREKRLKMYRMKDPELLSEILPALNAIMHDVERYREWIKTSEI